MGSPIEAKALSHIAKAVRALSDVPKIDRMIGALNNEHGMDQVILAQEGLKLIDTLLRKNTDYGSSAWQGPIMAPGTSIDTAIRVRMSDKIARLRNLLEPDSRAEVDESIEDTMRDLAGYIVLWLARPSRSIERLARRGPASEAEAIGTA